MTKASAYLFIGLIFTGLSISAANAAPQALALVNSGGEVALQCHDDNCIASLSAYCLQKERSVPSTGTTYNFADVGQVRLVGIKKDGSRVLLDAANELRVAALRRQVAVSVAIPKSRLEELGLRAVTVDIGPDVTLLPRAVVGDKTPLSESEIALATGPLRKLGTRVVESDPNRIGAARWILRLSDTLPPTATLDPNSRAQFIDQARRDSVNVGLSTSARDQAGDLLTVCQVHTKLGGYGSLRECFEQRHDTLLWELNVGFWLADSYGS
jgi:hypothetical protein